MHPANTEDARNGAGQSQTCRVLETPNTLGNRNMRFLLLGFLANFPEYFPEKRVMRNGFFFSEKQKLRCSFRKACAAETALQHSLSAVRKSFVPKAALQQTKNCTATSKKLRCRKVALSCRFSAGFQAPTFRHPRFGLADVGMVLRKFCDKLLHGTASGGTS